MKTTTLTWYRNVLGEKVKYEQDIAIHPLNNGKIIVNYPGAEGDIDGYNNKYRTLAIHMVDKGLGAVVRCGNPYVGKWDTSLRHMLIHILENANEICGSDTPEVYLMGFSVGAGAISILAWEYPEITKILLMAPTDKVGESEVKKGLGLFKGEVYIVIGNQDEIVTPESGELFLNMCTSASHKELIMIENCDHQFRTEKNGRIMSEAPFYAFLDTNKPKFPSKRGGIFLYD